MEIGRFFNAPRVDISEIITNTQLLKQFYKSEVLNIFFLLIEQLHLYFSSILISYFIFALFFRKLFF